MRPSLSIKTLFRTPFKTLLTFFLFAAVKFALFSRVAEYSITDREVKNAAKEYRGVGSVEISPAPQSYPGTPCYLNADPRVLRSFPQEQRNYYLDNLKYKPLSQEQINSILGLPYITSINTRYMTAGVSNEYYRLDDGKEFYNYTARFVIEGTLSEVNYDVKNYSGDRYNIMTLDDCDILAGMSSWLPKNKKIEISAWPYKVKQNSMLGISNAERATILLEESYIYDTEYIRNLNIGDRYVIIGRLEPLEKPIPFYLGDYLSNSWCEVIQSVGVQPENYLKTAQFAPLHKLIEMADSDLHTFDVVYTDDLSSIMRFTEGDMALISGRELTKEDSINESRVCVVSNKFTAQNSLDIGDSITLKLGTELFEQYKSLGAVAAVRERLSPLDEAVELEIVGIYMDTDWLRNQAQKPHWCYSSNTVFVPRSLLPLDDNKLSGRMFSPVEFSFTVGNAWNIPSFVEKATPLINEMGLKLIFYDDGWPEIVDEFVMSAKMSII